MKPALNQAVVFLTHRPDDTVLRHFSRLRQETEDLLPTFLCVHEQPGSAGPAQVPADFRIRMSLAARMLPVRYAVFRSIRGRFEKGFTDLLSIPILLDRRLDGYDHVWTVEHDVDYAGHWSSFFLRAAGSPADLLGTTIYPREACPEWFHWRRFRAPPDVAPGAQLRSFLPIVRFSRRFLHIYVNAVRDPRWQGHSEALFPTIARHHACLVEDLGGTGPFCPSPWLSTNYSNSPETDDLSPGTLVYRPAASQYFHDAPERFSRREHLYHPVKPPTASPAGGTARAP